MGTRDAWDRVYPRGYDVPRSYIEDKFPEGPANGVFPRDPDLRDFVALLSATAMLACAVGSTVENVSQLHTSMPRSASIAR